MMNITIPLDWNLSKNRARSISTRNGKIRSYKNAHHKKLQNDLELLIKTEKNKIGWILEKKKLFLIVKVHKKDYTGDAINLLDPIADAVKKAIGLDDCWFVALITWELNHEQKIDIYLTQNIDDYFCLISMSS